MSNDSLARARDGGVGGTLDEQRALDDLKGIMQDFDGAVGGVDDLGQWGARTDPLTLLAKIEQLMEHGERRHWGGIHPRLAEHLHHMARRFHHLVSRNIQLERELEILNMSSNVVVSTPIDNLNPATTSTVVTLGTPYSGVDWALCAMLLPAELTPPGRFASLQFMGIDFANPSINPVVVQYLATAGTLGAPLVQGMGLSSFYTNLTSPRGPRVFEPWVGWIFDASAKVSFQMYNPSATLNATYLLDWMMRASPCPQPGISVFDPEMVRGHVLYNEGVASMFDAIHHGVIGMGNHLNGRGKAGKFVRNGMEMLSRWAVPGAGGSGYSATGFR